MSASLRRQQLELVHLGVQLRDPLLQVAQRGARLAERLLRGAHLAEPALHGAHSVEPRAPRVVVPAGERAAAVHLVAVERDGVHPGTAHVGAGHLEARADDRLAKHLAERGEQRLVELQLAQHHHGVLRLRVRHGLGAQPVERHEGHPPGALAPEVLEQPARSCVRVDHDVEERGARGRLDRGLVPLVHREELVERPVDAVQLLPLRDGLDRLDPGRGRPVHGGCERTLRGAQLVTRMREGGVRLGLALPELFLALGELVALLLGGAPGVAELRECVPPLLGAALERGAALAELREARLAGGHAALRVRLELAQGGLEGGELLGLLLQGLVPRRLGRELGGAPLLGVERGDARPGALVLAAGLLERVERVLLRARLARECLVLGAQLCGDRLELRLEVCAAVRGAVLGVVQVLERAVEVRALAAELAALLLELRAVERGLLELLLGACELLLEAGDGLVALDELGAPRVALVHLAPPVALVCVEQLGHVRELALVDGVLEAAALPVARVELLQVALLLAELGDAGVDLGEQLGDRVGLVLRGALQRDALVAPLLVHPGARDLLEQREALAVGGVGDVRDLALRHDVVGVAAAEPGALEQVAHLGPGRHLAVDHELVLGGAHRAAEHHLVAAGGEAGVGVVKHDLDVRRERRRGGAARVVEERLALLPGHGRVRVAEHKAHRGEKVALAAPVAPDHDVVVRAERVHGDRVAERLEPVDRERLPVSRAARRRHAP